MESFPAGHVVEQVLSPPQLVAQVGKERDGAEEGVFDEPPHPELLFPEPQTQRGDPAGKPPDRDHPPRPRPDHFPDYGRGDSSG